MKCPPYTTRTGIKIGVYYQAPLRADFTAEEYRIQNVLLGSAHPLVPLSYPTLAFYAAVVILLIILGKTMS